MATVPSQSGRPPDQGLVGRPAWESAGASGTEVDDAKVEASVAEGGLAVFDREGFLLHAAPPDVTNSLRFFLSRLWQSGEVGFPPTMAVTSALVGRGRHDRCSQRRRNHRSRPRSQRVRGRDELVVHARNRARDRSANRSRRRAVRQVHRRRSPRPYHRRSFGHAHSGRASGCRSARSRRRAAPSPTC